MTIDNGECRERGHRHVYCRTLSGGLSFVSIDSVDNWYCGGLTCNDDIRVQLCRSGYPETDGLMKMFVLAPLQLVVLQTSTLSLDHIPEYTGHCLEYKLS